MKKIYLLAAVAIMVCAAAVGGYKVYDNHSMSKFSALMIKNLEVLAEDENSVYQDYYNKGEYRVTRDGDGGGGATIDEDSFNANVQYESDVVLIVYINDCKWKKNRKCYESMRKSEVFYKRD